MESAGNGTVLRTIREAAEAVLEEKRSVFRAAVRRISDEEAAAAFLRERRRAYPDARHTVYAYRLESGAERSSDDGEPGGTAGAPTLEAIRRAGLSDVCVATTRIFGGILLGTGGLTRAYAAAAARALTAAGVVEFVPFTDFLLDCTYPDHQRLLPLLAQMGARERGTDFSDRVRLRVGLPSAAAEDFCARVSELTAGRCQPRALGVTRDTAP